jgi:hypothetical protein
MKKALAFAILRGMGGYRADDLCSRVPIRKIRLDMMALVEAARGQSDRSLFISYAFPDVCHQDKAKEA